VQQPRATPWVNKNSKRSLKGCKKRSTLGTSFLAALQAASIVFIYPGRCPGLLHFQPFRLFFKVLLPLKAAFLRNLTLEIR